MALELKPRSQGVTNPSGTHQSPHAQPADGFDYVWLAAFIHAVNLEDGKRWRRWIGQQNLQWKQWKSKPELVKES